MRGGRGCHGMEIPGSELLLKWDGNALVGVRLLNLNIEKWRQKVG